MSTSDMNGRFEAGMVVELKQGAERSGDWDEYCMQIINDLQYMTRDLMCDSRWALNYRPMRKTFALLMSCQSAAVA